MINGRTYYPIKRNGMTCSWRTLDNQKGKDILIQIWSLKGTDRGWEYDKPLSPSIHSEVYEVMAWDDIVEGGGIKTGLLFDKCLNMTQEESDIRYMMYILGKVGGDTCG